MADNKHCPDHCGLSNDVIEIKTDVKWIKDRLSGSWADVKWLIAIVPGMIAIWMKG